MRRPPAVRTALAVAVLAGLLAAAEGRAESVRVESVGVAAADADGSAGETPRAAATRDALSGAVRVVARRLLGGTVPDPEALDRALGDDPYPYLVRFRVLEDRGVRPRLLHPDPSVAREHVVAVETTVDAERVRRALEAAGLRVPENDAASAETLRIALEGVSRWEQYRAVRAALEADGAQVVPLEFAPGRVVLSVRTLRDAQQILEMLRGQLGPRLRLVPLAVGPDELRLRIGATRGGRAPAQAAR